MKKLIRRLLNKFSSEINLHNDIYAISFLQGFLKDNYIPFSIAALRPYVLVTIINDIIINDRKTIIEFGSGVSTLLIADVLTKNNIDGKLISIEENKDWADKLQNILKLNGNADKVEIIHCPLKKTEKTYSLPVNVWYDEKILMNRLRTVGDIDTLIVDGPKSDLSGDYYDRFPALDFVKPYLNENCSIFLDDVNRNKEKKILKQWAENIGAPSLVKGGDLGLILKGDWFNFYLI